MSNKYIVHTDGGARGNPGPAALGVVITDEAGKMIKEFGEYIGEKTNNEAEYRAPIEALKAIKASIGAKKAKDSVIEIFMDSTLVVKQMNREYKVSHPNIQSFFIELWNATLDFKEVTFTHVRREKNKEADAQVNKALDAEVGGSATLF